MDIIRKANDLRNILSQEDLLLFENYSLDKVYELANVGACSKGTKLMLLINLLHKYPTEAINEIIKIYVKEVPNEINNINSESVNALMVCAKDNFVETMEILLNNGIDINTRNGLGWTAAHYAAYYENLSAIKLLIEYDANMSLITINYNTPLKLISGMEDKNRIRKIMRDIEILNVKN